MNSKTASITQRHLENKWHQHIISNLVIKKLFGTLANKKILILGFAFKANTNDTRESPAISICKDLLLEGAFLSIYDPQVEINQIQNDLFKNGDDNSKVCVASTIQESVRHTDAIIILTEWEEFKKINWDKLIPLMRKPSWLFDTRGIINSQKLISLGINVWTVGKAN